MGLRWIVCPQHQFEVEQVISPASHLTLFIQYNFFLHAPTDRKVVSNDKDLNYASFDTNLTSKVESIKGKKQLNERL